MTFLSVRKSSYKEICNVHIKQTEYNFVRTGK